MGQAASQDEETKQLLADLQQAYWFALDHGKIVEARVTSGVSPEAVSILRTVSSSLQLAEADSVASSPQQGAAGAGKTWLAQEFDSTGRYEAKYEGSGDGVTKHKVRFLDTLTFGKVQAAQRAAMLPEVKHSTIKLQIQTNRLERVDLDEELHSTLLGSTAVTVKTTLSLIRRKTDATQQAQALDMNAALGGLVPAPPEQAYGAGRTRDQFNTLRAEGVTFAQVLAELERQAEDPKKIAFVQSINSKSTNEDQAQLAKEQLQQRVEVFSKLTGLLRTNPDALKELESAVLKPSVAATALLDGLSQADTPEAQSLLAGFVHHPQLSRDLELGAATSLIRVRTPTPATIEFLMTLRNDPLLQDHAIYGLGTAARRLRETGQQTQSNAIVAELRAGLATAQGTAERVRFLRGIANAAAFAAIPSLRPMLTAEDADVRRSAVEALRLLENDEVDLILKDRLANEPEARVRATVLRIIEGRSVNPILQGAVTAAAKSDPDKAIQTAAAKLLERWSAKRNQPETTRGSIGN